MKALRLLFLGAIPLAALLGCATPGQIPSSPDNSLVVGYIDTSAVPFLDLLSVWYKQTSPPADKPYRAFAGKKGYFYGEVVPGTYTFTKLFVGPLGGLNGNATEVDPPKSGPSGLDFQAGPRTVVSLGALKITPGAAFTNKANLTPTSAPDEKAMLNWLLNNVKDRARWQDVINQRIAQIGG